MLLKQKNNNKEQQDTKPLKVLIVILYIYSSQYDTCESMLLKFEGIWKDFIQAIISNLQDFISLKQLGVLLPHLANEGNCDLNML
jgi:hypothetical protein